MTSLSMAKFFKLIEIGQSKILYSYLSSGCFARRQKILKGNYEEGRRKYQNDEMKLILIG